MSRAQKTTLEDLHGLVAEELGIRLSGGDWSPADMASAIKFLKDNGVVNAFDNKVNLLADTLDDISEEDLPESLRIVK